MSFIGLETLCHRCSIAGGKGIEPIVPGDEGLELGKLIDLPIKLPIDLAIDITDRFTDHLAIQQQTLGCVIELPQVPRDKRPRQGA